MTRIVLDTNVIVSALMQRSGVPGQVLQLVLAGELVVVVDPRILAEYDEVLRRPRFCIYPDEVNDLLAFLDENAAKVIVLPLPSVSIDPKDQVFVETAVAAKADYLVTGNLKHFKHLQKYHVRVVSPKQLLDNLC